MNNPKLKMIGQMLKEFFNNDDHKALQEQQAKDLEHQKQIKEATNN